MRVTRRARRHCNSRGGQALWFRCWRRPGQIRPSRKSAANTAGPVTCESWGTQRFFALANSDVVADCIAGGADIGSVVGRGTRAASPLSVASASTRNADVIRVLLQAGADVAARDDFYGYTPLHNAARTGTAEVVRALLEAGADPDAWATGFSVDWGWGWTPLHLAARSNPDPEVVRVLVEGGADLDVPSGESYRQGNTPLHYAGANPNPDVAAALLDAGADVNALSASGRTPLHEVAANASNSAVIELLVAAGGDVNAHDRNGYTPLHSAAWYNPRPEIATTLIAAGADVNARDPDGYVSCRAGRKRPHAAVHGRIPRLGRNLQRHPHAHQAQCPRRGGAGGRRIGPGTDGRIRAHPIACGRDLEPRRLPLLLRLGADPDARDADGKTPLDYALENRSLEGLPEVRRLREAMRRGGAGR